MVNSLRKVHFSHPTGHYTWTKFRAPLEKILGAPLSPQAARATCCCYHSHATVLISFIV